MSAGSGQTAIWDSLCCLLGAVSLRCRALNTICAGKGDILKRISALALRRAVFSGSSCPAARLLCRVHSLTCSVCLAAGCYWFCWKESLVSSVRFLWFAQSASAGPAYRNPYTLTHPSHPRPPGLAWIRAGYSTARKHAAASQHIVLLLQPSRRCCCSVGAVRASEEPAGALPGLLGRFVLLLTIRAAVVSAVLHSLACRPPAPADYRPTLINVPPPTGECMHACVPGVVHSLRSSYSGVQCAESPSAVQRTTRECITTDYPSLHSSASGLPSLLLLPRTRTRRCPHSATPRRKRIVSRSIYSPSPPPNAHNNNRSALVATQAHRSARAGHCDLTTQTTRHAVHRSGFWSAHSIGAIVCWK